MSDVDETRRISKRFTVGLVLIAAGFFASCATEDHTVEITALREGVADTQSLVDEYKARVAELRASTTTSAPVALPTEPPEVQPCLFPRERLGDDPPIGSPSASDEPIRLVEMRLRSGPRSGLLVPESWVLDGGDCTYVGNRVWVNPANDRERVVHFIGDLQVDDRSPARDATFDINWHVSVWADVFLDGATIRITERCSVVSTSKRSPTTGT